MQIVIYDSTTGEILRCVSCPPSMVDIQCAPGESYIEAAKVSDKEYRVDIVECAIVPLP